MNQPTLREWIADRPFSLALSSGFFGFFAHAGMLSALEDEGSLPEQTCGSSAGALIAGAWAAGVNAETIGSVLCELRRPDFWDPRPGLGLLRGALFRQRLEQLLPTRRFSATRVPVCVSVFDLFERRTTVLRSGDLAAAIHASCAVPLLFQPVWIDGHPLVDGGVADRPGIAGLAADSRVLFHHLSSKSPWRRKAPPIPTRPSLTALIIEGLPRLGPFSLERGELAFEKARRATRQALSRTLNHLGHVCVEA